jgi:hypothetical protein
MIKQIGDSLANDKNFVEPLGNAQLYWKPCEPPISQSAHQFSLAAEW